MISHFDLDSPYFPGPILESRRSYRMHTHLEIEFQVLIKLLKLILIIYFLNKMPDN
jgi:hypothetical protein